MIDLFTLSKGCSNGKYTCIPESAWTQVDAIFDQTKASGFRILPNFTFKLDPNDPILSSYCAIWGQKNANGDIKLVPAVANQSCLPQYANADYSGMINNLFRLAIQHMEEKYGDTVIGYEPASGVASEIDWMGANTNQVVYGDLSKSMIDFFHRHLSILGGLNNNTKEQVAIINTKLGTQFRSIDEINLPSHYPPDSGNPPDSGKVSVRNEEFTGQLGEQYALARAEIIINFYSHLHAIQQSIAPTKLYALPMGAIIDQEAVTRSTIFFQQYAKNIHPDIMMSDASTFNHLYEGPITAMTRYQQNAQGLAIKSPDAPAWGSFVDRFPTYAPKNIDYHQSALQQLKDSFEHNDFRLVGFYMSPSEMLETTDYMAFLQTLVPYFTTPPTADHVPTKFANINLSWIIEQFSTVGYEPNILPRIRMITNDFKQTVAIRLYPDIPQLPNTRSPVLNPANPGQ